MAKIGAYRRIFKQDYSEQNQQDIDTLSITVNDSFESIYDALTNQVTFSDNINCTLVTFSCTVGSDSVPLNPTTLKLATYQKSVNGILVINAVSSTKTVLPDAGIFINYAINNNVTSSSNTTNNGNSTTNPLTINISNIKGLPANTPFTLTVIVI